MTPAAEPAPGQAGQSPRVPVPGNERRAAPRYRCPPATVGRLYVLEKDDTVVCEVDNLSATGIGLRSSHAFDAGADVFIHMKVPRTRSGLNLVAVVTHCTADVGGAWAVGCKFNRPLTPDVLDALLD